MNDDDNGQPFLSRRINSGQSSAKPRAKKNSINIGNNDCGDCSNNESYDKDDDNSIDYVAIAAEKKVPAAHIERSTKTRVRAKKIKLIYIFLFSFTGHIYFHTSRYINVFFI